MFLNVSLMLLIVLSCVIFDSGSGEIVVAMLSYGGLIFASANGFMFLKALWTRDFLLAFLYLILVVSAFYLTSFIWKNLKGMHA